MSSSRIGTTTIQEQLREIVADQQPGICLHEVAAEAADVIDALVEDKERDRIAIAMLVEAVNVARRSMPLNIGASPHVRAAHKVVDAALSRARGDK